MWLSQYDNKVPPHTAKCLPYISCTSCTIGEPTLEGVGQCYIITILEEASAWWASRCATYDVWGVLAGLRSILSPPRQEPPCQPALCHESALHHSGYHTQFWNSTEPTIQLGMCTRTGTVHKFGRIATLDPMKLSGPNLQHVLQRRRQRAVLKLCVCIVLALRKRIAVRVRVDKYRETGDSTDALYSRSKQSTNQS